MEEPKSELGKSKPTRFSRLFAIDIVVPLPLEVCILQLERYAANARLRFTLRRSQAGDRVEFQVIRNSSAPRIVFASGILEPVEGGSTRIRGRINRAHTVEVEVDSAGTWQRRLWVLATVVFFLAIGVIPVLHPQFGMLLALIVFAIVFIVLPTLWYALYFAETYLQRRFFIRCLRRLLTAKT